MIHSGVKVVIYSSHFKWVIGGLVRDAAKVAKVKLNWLIIFERKIHRLKPILYFYKVKKNKSKVILYTHYSLLSKVKLSKKYLKSVLLIFQIQNIEDFISKNNLLLVNNVDKIVVQNSITKDFLVENGINSDKIRVNFGGVDRSIYFPSHNKKDYVLISGDFKQRKNPQGIIRVIKSNPDINFIIHGKNLSLFSNIKDYDNLKLINWDKQLQPILMREARLFLTLSTLEGGPISILESLASGTPVVATDTGIARDVVTSSCGSVIPIDFKINDIRVQIKKWIEHSNTNEPKDFLNGKNTFNDYANEIFN
jgi:glycosyltransferase involved in cell wall biosynthesis